MTRASLPGARRLLVRVATLALIGLVAGCAGPRANVTLLPDGEGRSGTLTVQPSTGAAFVLDRAYASASVAGGSASTTQSSAEEVHAKFAAALAAQPAPPLSFVVYFVEGRDELTAASQAELPRILDAIGRRPAPDVMVVGHTDRVGKLEDNDRLAQKRAARIRDTLIDRGIPADSVQAAGRGEREPLVPTADEVDEARNRRVEIVVR
jgi:outer membrane protein OmpA-like peptidoglycan-associated protein